MRYERILALLVCAVAVVPEQELFQREKQYNPRHDGNSHRKLTHPAFKSFRDEMNKRVAKKRTRGKPYKEKHGALESRLPHRKSYQPRERDKADYRHRTKRVYPYHAKRIPYLSAIFYPN